jgi:hypothetical protein
MHFLVTIELISHCSEQTSSIPAHLFDHKTFLLHPLGENVILLQGEIILSNEHVSQIKINRVLQKVGYHSNHKTTLFFYSLTKLGA